MKVAIASVQVPFIRGGAEVLAESLRRELRSRGYETELVTIPFKWYPPEVLVESMVAGRMLDLTEVNGERIDVVVAMKFPAYYLRHPRKVLYLMHQHRQVYDLWGTSLSDVQSLPGGTTLRSMIAEHDSKYLSEAWPRFTISRNVSQRLLQYNNLDSTPLYPPPDFAERFYTDAYEPFIFYPSRIDAMKRQRLLIEAARHMRSGAKVVIAGIGSEGETASLRSAIHEFELEDRVRLVGFISDEEKLSYYARCRAVFFGGVDEDLGYIPLEAFLARKPVITLCDSGAALEFVTDGINGFVRAPDAGEVAAVLDQLADDCPLAERLGQAGWQSLADKNITWDHVISQLMGRDNE